MANAYVLSKLPENEQMNYLNLACTEDPKRFIPMILKKLRSKKKG